MELEDAIRVGVVSDVDKDKHRARVIYPGQDNMVSAWLQVIQNRPLITIEKTVDGETWEYDAQYCSYDRELGLGETYVKGEITTVNTYDEGSYEVYETLKPDVITNTKDIHYKKLLDIGGPASLTTCSDGCSVPVITNTGEIEIKTHTETVTVYPWLPYIGQRVLCVYLPVFNGDGYIIGGF